MSIPDDSDRAKGSAPGNTSLTSRTVLGPGRSTALTTRAPVGPAPPMRFSRSLASAAPRTFLHVDGKGQVRSPTRYKVLQGATYAAVGTIVLSVTGIYGALLGAPGVVVGLGLGAWFAYVIRRGHGIRKALRLLAHDRLDEAEVVLHKVRSSPLCPRSLRATVEHNLGAIALRRCRYDEALGHQRAALALYARTRGQKLMQHFTSYAEVATLVNLGRVGEARGRFDTHTAGGPPSGDYLAMQHQVAELYLCLAEGRHQLGSDELHARSRVALAVTGAAALLGLLAWAQHQLADDDQAWHLLREAFDRRHQHHLREVMPLLDAWMEAHAAAAGVDLDELAERERGEDEGRLAE